VLTATSATWTGTQPVTATWRWLRCADGEFKSCAVIQGASSTGYTATQDDFGRRVRVWLHVANAGGSADAVSAPTAVIAAAPEPTPTPTPDPTATPTPEPTATATPDPTATATATPEPAVLPAPTADPLALAIPAGAVLGTRAVSLLEPFPVVRIRGRLTRAGVRVTLLTVRAPHGARIVMRCSGRGCPVNRWAHATVLTRVSRLQRTLPAGTRIVITVTRPGFVGKHTLLVIRRGRPPLRRDRCLDPGTTRPIPCPAR
jgi:hypothetical protein